MYKNVSHENIQSLGILAGGGVLPSRLAEECVKSGITPYIIAFEGQADQNGIDTYDHVWMPLGAIGAILKKLKSQNITDIVMIGRIRRPSFHELKPDLKAAEIIARIGLKALGDNDILSLLRDELHKEGITVHGVQNFMSGLLTRAGAIGRYKPSVKYTETIKRGVEVARGLGQLDVGQSVIVQNGLVIGVEGIEGTDELVRRCKGYLRKGGGAILVKTCKPHQDKYLDLPTIGPDTIRVAVEAGLSGIIIEAGSSLMIDPLEIAEIANRHKIFVYGISITDYVSP